MDLYEHEGKQLLAQYGVAVPRGDLACSPTEAVAIQRALGGPVVVKAQVLNGGRGKAGLIRFADERDIDQVTTALLGLSHKGEQVRSVLVEERLVSRAELYVSVYVDTVVRCRKLLVSATGGIDIEAAQHTVRQFPFRRRDPPSTHLIQTIWEEIGNDRLPAQPLARLTGSLIGLFLDTRARQVEVNPIGVVDSRVFALDAKLTVEDDAELPIRHNFAPVDLEENARRLGIPLVRLEGDIGIITSGAGLGLATIDTVHRCGGRAANFLDLGGGATPERMRSAIELVKKLEGLRGLFVNVHGGLNDCQLLAQGVFAGLGNKTKLPVLIRMSGFHATEGLALLEAGGIPTAGGEQMEHCIHRLLHSMGNRASHEHTINLLPLLNSETPILLQGISGRQGRSQVQRLLSSGTRLVAGVAPGHAGESIEGVSVFNCVADAVTENTCPSGHDYGASGIGPSCGARSI